MTCCTHARNMVGWYDMSKLKTKRMRNRRMVNFTDAEDRAIARASRADGWPQWARKVLLDAARKDGGAR